MACSPMQLCDRVQVNNSFQTEDSHVLLMILEELKKLQKTVNLLFSSREEQVKYACCAERINRAFFTFYVFTVTLFLSFIFMEWNS